MAFCWIKQRGETWWLYYARSVGSTPESLRTSDKSFAEEVQRRRESEIFCGVHGIQKATVKNIRFSELLKLYIDHKNAAGLDAKTVKNYKTLLNHFGDYLKGDIYAQQITLETIENFVAFRRSLNKAPKTIRNEVFTLVNFFSWGKDRGHLASDPTERLPKPKRVSYDAPRYLTFAEYLSLKACITIPKFSDFVDFYLLTGIRREDGLRVSSENFDFERMMATLPQHKQGNTKKIPISRDLFHVVKRLIARAGPGNPLIDMHVSRLSTNFANARDKAKLPDSITFHSLRHTFASWLAAAGVDLKTVQELIGHKSAESTQIYVHAFNENKRSAIEKLHLPRAGVKRRAYKYGTTG